jgi:ribosomal protein S20
MRIMKKRNIVSAIVLTLAIGMGVTAYAASSDSTTGAPGTRQKLGLGRITSMRGYDYVSNALKTLGVKESDITAARASGKAFYDLAADNKISQEDLRKALLKEREKAIDEAVKKGTISKADGETLKTNLSANMESCTGEFGQNQGSCGVQGQGGCGTRSGGQGSMQGMGRGQGRGMMRNGQGIFNQAAPKGGATN